MAEHAKGDARTPASALPSAAEDVLPLASATLCRTAFLEDRIEVHCPGSQKQDDLSAENTSGEVHAVIGPGARPYNQDFMGAFLPDQGGATLYVLDGHDEFGEIAAKIASGLITKGVEANIGGTGALSSIGSDFQEIVLSKHDEYINCMGTCAVVADIRSGYVTFAHIGDSRGYLLSRGEDGKYAPRYVTKDHSFVQRMLDAGHSIESIDPSYKRFITRSINARGSDDYDTSADISDPIEVRADDLILLMSDGALIIDISEIIACCNNPNNHTPEDIVNEVNAKIAEAIKAGIHAGSRPDNFAFMAFKYLANTAN